MIARFRILLAQEFSIPAGTDLKPFELIVEGIAVRVYPPLKALATIHELRQSQLPLREMVLKLSPAPQEPGKRILINGIPTIDANMLQLEICAPEFDRRKDVVHTQLVGEFDIFFRAVDLVIARLRTVSRAVYLKPIAPSETIWLVDYLNSDGSELPQQDGLFRRRFSKSFHFSAIGVNDETWHLTQTLPDHLVLRTWEALILDAQASLPEVGPAIVLAHTALETFIVYSLDVMQARVDPPLPVGLWDWLNDRGNFLKDPSTEERFDAVLKFLTGASLKDEVSLWEVFKQVRAARNSFVHEGIAKCGRDVIDTKKAGELVGGAAAIIDWVEKLLPQELQRRKHSTVEFMFALPILE